MNAIDVAIARLTPRNMTPAEQGLLAALVIFRDRAAYPAHWVATAENVIREQGHGHLLPIGELSDREESLLTDHC